MRNAEKGFTLIELMITVAIVAILAAIAYPSYTEYVMRSRRVEGQNLLNEANTYSINGNRMLPQGYYRYGASVKLGVSYRF